MSCGVWWWCPFPAKKEGREIGRLNSTSLHNQPHHQPTLSNFQPPIHIKTTMALLSPTRPLLQQARVLLVGSGRMGHIRAKAIFSNPRFEFDGIVDENVDGAKRLADVYRVSSVVGADSIYSGPVILSRSHNISFLAFIKHRHHTTHR